MQATKILPQTTLRQQLVWDLTNWLIFSPFFNSKLHDERVAK